MFNPPLESAKSKDEGKKQMEKRWQDTSPHPSRKELFFTKNPQRICPCLYLPFSYLPRERSRNLLIFGVQERFFWFSSDVQTICSVFLPAFVWECLMCALRTLSPLAAMQPLLKRQLNCPPCEGFWADESARGNIFYFQSKRERLER